MPTKVTDFNGGVALTSIEDTDIIYVIRGGTDQFAEMETVRAYNGGLIPFEKTITSAEILAGTNVVAVAAQGANTYIESVGRLFCENGAGTTPYDGLQIGLGFAAFPFALIESDRAAGAKHFAAINPASSPALTANEDLTFQFPFGTPSGGDYDITIRGFYRVIDLN